MKKFSLTKISILAVFGVLIFNTNLNAGEYFQKPLISLPEGWTMNITTQPFIPWNNYSLHHGKGLKHHEEYAFSNKSIESLAKKYFATNSIELTVDKDAYIDGHIEHFIAKYFDTQIISYFNHNGTKYDADVVPQGFIDGVTTGFNRENLAYFWPEAPYYNQTPNNAILESQKWGELELTSGQEAKWYEYDKWYKKAVSDVPQEERGRQSIDDVWKKAEKYNAIITYEIVIPSGIAEGHIKHILRHYFSGCDGQLVKIAGMPDIVCKIYQIPTGWCDGLTMVPNSNSRYAFEPTGKREYPN